MRLEHRLGSYDIIIIGRGWVNDKQLLCERSIQTVPEDRFSTLQTLGPAARAVAVGPPNQPHFTSNVLLP